MRTLLRVGLEEGFGSSSVEIGIPDVRHESPDASDSLRPIYGIVCAASLVAGGG
jgi:hypothetical protein